MMVAISGVRPETPFWDKLQKDKCKSLQEFYRCADKIMLLETAHEAVQVGKFTPSEKNNDYSKKRKNGDHRPSSDKTNKKAKASDLRVLPSLLGKFTNYTNLATSREDFFWLQSSREYLSGLTRCREITLRGIRTSSVDSIKISAIPPRSASP